MKIKDSKGFTLIELLVTIAILAAILLIAIPTTNTIASSIKERQHYNLIKFIENAASDYAFDTGNTYAFVDTLIKEGYLQADNENGELFDPNNNYRINCHIVEMKKVGDGYKARYNTTNFEREDGTCDEDSLIDRTASIKILVYQDNNLITDTTKWLSGNVILEAYSDNVKIDCEKSECVWSSTSGSNIVGKAVINLNINNMLETKYTFQIGIRDKETEELKRYAKTVGLKIDNEAPTIDVAGITITPRNVPSTFKTVTISATDGSGSGINGYALVLGSSANAESVCRSVNTKYQKDKRFQVTSNGNYIVCVKDKVNNIAIHGNLTVSNIN